MLLLLIICCQTLGRCPTSAPKMKDMSPVMCVKNVSVPTPYFFIFGKVLKFQSIH